MVSGQAWLAMEGVAEPVRLQAGDWSCCRGACPFASPATWPWPQSTSRRFSQVTDGSIASLNGGGDCFGIGGYFDFAGPHAGVLLGVLPPIVHIRMNPTRRPCAGLSSA